jgi:hypothetical protein
MSEPPNEATANTSTTETCARCSKTLSEGDRVAAGDRAFCGSCYETLRMELEQAVAQMSSNINYPMALVGAVLGGTLGVLVWWGFTVATHLAFGLIAVAIGFLVAHGAVRLAGNKRSGGLQVISISVSVLSFVVASYLVNMTFINQELAKSGELWRVGFPPPSLDALVKVVSMGFGAMDIVFLAIVVWESWKIPKPIKLIQQPLA